MKKYMVRIKGIQPVIWNVMKREIEEEKEKLKKNQLKEWEKERKNWIRKAEIDKNVIQSNTRPSLREIRILSKLDTPAKVSSCIKEPSTIFDPFVNLK